LIHPENKKAQKSGKSFCFDFWNIAFFGDLFKWQ